MLVQLLTANAICGAKLGLDCAVDLGKLDILVLELSRSCFVVRS